MRRNDIVTDVNVRFLSYFDYHFIAYNITIRFLKTCKFYIGFGEMRFACV